MTRLVLLLALLLALPFALPTRAQEAPPVGTCELGVATADLDVGGVRARLYNTGGLFWRGGDPVYEVPQGSGGELFFAASLWLGGTVDGEVRFAGGDYADWEWWPGPLDADGHPPADCAAFDRIYLVTQQPDGSLTGDVANWPADLGAPFGDLDGDGVYEPEAGETPTVYGHQAAFWVMNDRGNEHRWSLTEPLGVTARVTAHAFNSDDPALGFGTFYRYTFENPNAYTIENARFGFWSETELGNYFDNYAGTDPSRGLTIAYNADDYNEPERPDDTGFYGPQPPAYGIDFLSGAAGMLYSTGDGSNAGNVVNGDEAYGYLNFIWRDGNPLTIGGNGYNPGSTDSTTWAWPGAPEQLAFWSEFNTDGSGTANHPAGGQYPISVAAPFELAPGATHSVDMAIVWGRGVSFLDSVTKVREHSDRVQAAYDAGTLFVPGGPQTGPPDGSAPPLPAPTLAAPVLTFPANGADLADLELPYTNVFCEADDPPEDCTEVALAWEPVPGALLYEIQVANTPDAFDDEGPRLQALEETTLATAYTDDERVDFYWRVRARTATELSAYSEPFVYRSRLRFVPGFQDQGRGIVEVAYAGTTTCTDDPARSGCAEYSGATVWHTPSTNADYYVGADPVNRATHDGTINALGFRNQIASPFDYEMRFTEACVTDGCWAVHTLFDGRRDEGLAIRVPFELWQIDPDDPDGAVRMIPILRTGITGRADNGDEIRGEPGPTWNYGLFRGGWDGSGFDGGADPDAPVSDVVYWMMPDRPSGYDLFAADAAAAGPGGTITDSDAQEDPDPFAGDGTACRNQGFYVDFCHRNDEMPGLTSGARSFMAPVGRFQLADEARDGTPPPPGTTIRLLTTKPEPVANEDDGPLPTTLALAAYPNPTRGAATLAYALPESGPTTVTVYDVLGRRVAVLADGEEQAAGRHRAVLNTTRLASGVYVAVLETAARRQTQTLTVLR